MESSKLTEDNLNKLDEQLFIEPNSVPDKKVENKSPVNYSSIKYEDSEK